MKCHYCGVETEYPFCHHCGTRQQPAPVREEAPAVTPDLAGDEAEFAWKPFQSGELTHKAPEYPNYYFFDEEKEAEPETAVAVMEEPQVPAPVPEQPAALAPRIQLPVRRGLLKMIFLGVLTLGIYPAVIWSRMVTELNIVASRYDGERTMPFFGMLLLTPLTFGIYVLIWHHGLCRRLGAELQRRGVAYRFGAGDFWLWNILGSLILAGPFVFVHKLTKAMNLINEDFNIRG